MQAKLPYYRFVLALTAICTVALTSQPAGAQEPLNLHPYNGIFYQPWRDSRQETVRENINSLVHLNYFKSRTEALNERLESFSVLLGTDVYKTSLLGDLADDFGTEFFEWQRAVYHAYWGVLYRVYALNPFHGLSYSILTRNPAWPFVTMDHLEKIYYDLRSEPYFDDEKLKIRTIASRSYGLAIRCYLYWPDSGNWRYIERKTTGG